MTRYTQLPVFLLQVLDLDKAMGIVEGGGKGEEVIQLVLVCCASHSIHSTNGFPAGNKLFNMDEKTAWVM